MNLFKRLTALFLAVVLTCGLLPVGTLAAEQETTTFRMTHINPYYADVVTEADLRPAAAPGRQTYAAANFVKTVEEAGRVLAEQMKTREETALVYIWDSEFSQERFEALATDILDAAFVHTGVPTEGDYIHWHYAGCNIEGAYSMAEDGYHYTLTYTFTYHASAEQEAQVDAAVEKLLSDLNLN